MKDGFEIKVKLNKTKMSKFHTNKILKIVVLENEIELERAVSIYGKLRWMSKEDKNLVPIRKHLKTLINEYEKLNWQNIEDITEKNIAESDEAERIVETENLFIQQRKDLIKRKLKSNGLKQQDLGKILGHRKNYMSELINGIRPFSKNNLIILNQLLGISWSKLIPPFIDDKTKEQINLTLTELNKPKLKFKYDGWKEVQV